jgi:putative transposase
MANLRDEKTLQKLAAVHASIHNHFRQDRHLNRREIYKQTRAVALTAVALTEWQQLAA